MNRSEAIALEPPVEVSPCEDGDAWDGYVEGHPDATHYHRWAWRGVFRRAFGRHSTYFAARRGSEIAGVLPVVWFANRIFGRFGVSLPFVNYGGVLADDDQTARALLATASRESLARGGRHLELRHMPRRFADLPYRAHKVTMHLPLQSTTSEQFAVLDRKLRNQVRKADKAGLSVERGSMEAVPAFYDVFSENMRDLGTPVYTRRFFEEVVRAFPADTRVFCVKFHSRPIAASITMAHRNTVAVPWASSLRRFNPLCSNVRLYWEMLQYAVERRAEIFDFGRSTPDEGTFHFKRQWGAHPIPLHWEYALEPGRPVPDLSPKNPRFRVAVDVWKWLPLAVSRALGPHLVRHIPG